MDGFAVLVIEDTLAGQQGQGTFLFCTLEEGDVAFVIEHDEVIEAVSIEVDDEGGGAPLGGEGAGFRGPPGPGGFGGASIPRYADGLCGLQGIQATLAVVFVPDYLAPDGVGDDVLMTVVVPVGHGKGGVAPLGFAGALDRTIGSGHDADSFAIGLKVLRWCKGRRVIAVEIFDEGDVASGVACDNVVVTITVPVDAVRRDKGAELDVLGLLHEVDGGQELGYAVFDFTGMLHERDGTVFFADDKVHVAIFIPVDGGGHNHTEIHGEAFTVGGDHFTGCVVGCCARADVFEIGEVVDKAAAEEIEIAIVVEIGKVGRGHAVDIDAYALAFKADGVFVFGCGRSAGIFDDVDIAMEGAAQPVAITVISVIPAVLEPVPHADHDVEVAIAFKVYLFPLVGAGLFPVAEEFFLRVDFIALELLAFDGVFPDYGGGHENGAVFGVRDLCVGEGRAEAYRGCEEGRLAVAGNIFEEVGTVVGFIGTGNEEIIVTVLIIVHGHGPGPKSNTEFYGEIGLIIGHRLELVFGLGDGGGHEDDKGWDDFGHSLFPLLDEGP